MWRPPPVTLSPARRCAEAREPDQGPLLRCDHRMKRRLGDGRDVLILEPRETLLGSLACGAGRRVARTRLIRPLPAPRRGLPVGNLPPGPADVQSFNVQAERVVVLRRGAGL